MACNAGFGSNGDGAPRILSGQAIAGGSGAALDEMLGELRRTMMERTWAGVAIGGLAARWRMRVEKSPG